MSDVYTPDEAARTPSPRLRGGRVLATARALATAQKRIEELTNELAHTKKAMADQLHYDMKAVLSDTPENRATKRIEELERHLMNLFARIDRDGGQRSAKDSSLEESVRRVDAAIARANAELDQHPEQLRLVAEAVTTWCGGGRPPTEGESAHLDAIIAQVTKP